MSSDHVPQVTHPRLIEAHQAEVQSTALHPYGHEDPLEISRIEFESIVRDGFNFEEDTLEDIPTDDLVEGRES